MLEIKKLEEKDFDAFLELIDELAEFEKLDPPSKDARERMKKHYLEGKYEACLGFLDRKPVSYLVFFMTYSSFLGKPTFYLEDIYVSKDYRRRGFGQQLFDFCKELAEERECGRMDWAVLDWNKLAMDFYEKNGAKHMKDWFTYRLEF